MGIKAKPSLLVNSLAALALLLSPLPAATAVTVPSPANILPQIEARDFAVKVSKRSSSANTYLLDDVGDTKTQPGKILLFRRGTDPVMAFRVVKTYSDKKQFAAKRVRKYGDIQALEPGESYMALEKVGDVVIPPPTAQDKVDLKELETGAPPPPVPTAPGPDVHPFDPDLDSATSPPPAGGVDSDRSRDNIHDEDDEDPQAHFGMTIDEVYPLDPNNQWLTGGFGFFRNNGADKNGAYFAGGGLRYAYSLGRMMLLRRAHAQDSIAIELGAFYYKILSYQNDTDAYEVLPIIGTLRYNIVFGENFGIFFYGGIMQNNVTKVTGGDDVGKALLSSVFPAAGAGILFRVGPNWDARVDAGYDTVGLGLVLRF